MIDQTGCEVEQVPRMSFGEAVDALKHGKKVRREGWNGKGMYLYYVNVQISCYDYLQQETMRAVKGDYVAIKGNCVTLNEHINMRTADGSICVGWLASQADMLSSDWQIVT